MYKDPIWPDLVIMGCVILFAIAAGVLIGMVV